MKTTYDEIPVKWLEFIAPKKGHEFKMLNLQHDGGGGGGSRRSKANPANPGDQVETLQRSKKILRYKIQFLNCVVLLKLLLILITGF